MEPAWIGIGSQRSGTTWLSDLLLQHPKLSLNKRGKKELHFFERFVYEPFARKHVDEYHSLFGPMGGEWTPSYLRCLWIPELIREAAPNALLIVSLRHPVDRYMSGLRWYSRLRRAHVTHTWYRHGGVEAMWGGMYATQLDVWRRIVGDRMLVLQYEAVAADPVPTVERIWEHLGLAPVPLLNVASASRTSTAPSQYPMPAGLGDLFRPEVNRLVDEWGFDPDLWQLEG